MKKVTKEEEWREEAVVYRDLERPLDEEEKRAAVLDPKLALFGKIDLSFVRLLY